jgi:signal transduction histidine kinase
MARAAEAAEERASVMDSLWLETLHRICGRAAHELKGALNAVSVNLEVVRSRSGKPDTPASSVNKYATAASTQLDAVIAMTEAVLSLAREAREPVEIAMVVQKILDLLARVAQADGRRLEAGGAFDDLGRTSASGNAARFAIGRCLLAAVDASQDVRCTPIPPEDGGDPVVRIESSDGAVLAVDDDVIAAAAGAGIRIQAESSVISISFPR